MLIKLLCVLSIFSFLNSTSFEVGSFEIESNSSISAEMGNDVSFSEVENEHCDDCRDDDCSDSDDCCKSLCSCGPTYLAGEFFEITEVYSKALSRSRWYFFNHYKLPFLDPGLKPPLFS